MLPVKVFVGVAGKRPNIPYGHPVLDLPSTGNGVHYYSTSLIVVQGGIRVAHLGHWLSIQQPSYNLILLPYMVIDPYKYLIYQVIIFT